MLPDMHQLTVAALLRALRVFGDASGLRLNQRKSALLPMGPRLPDPLPAAVGGLAVVSQATVLGVPLGAAGRPLQPAAFWGARLQRVRACFGRLARLRLSAFGRAHAAASYGVSQLLYHAEFAGVPPDVQHSLAQLTSRLVDRGLAPADGRGGVVMPGVPSRLLAGRPSRAGFGMLPWASHITARHAVWGGRLLLHLLPRPAADAAPPPVWVGLAALLLREAQPALSPAAGLLSLCAVQHVEPGQRPWGGRLRARGPVPVLPRLAPAALPAPLSLMAEGLAALGPLRHIGAQQQGGGGAVLPAGGEAAVGEGGSQLSLLSLARVQRQDALGRVALAALARSVGWPVVGGGRGAAGRAGRRAAPLPPVRPLALRVRDATSQLQRPVEEERQRVLRGFVAAAAGGHLPSPTLQRYTSHLQQQLGRLWRVAWELQHKEPMWRLVLQGVPGAGGHGISTRAPCACGWRVPDGLVGACPHGAALWRQHVFWDCPVARAVVAELQRGLHQVAAAAPVALTRFDVWVMSPPVGLRVCGDAWAALCAAAVAAMAFGKRLLGALAQEAAAAAAPAAGGGGSQPAGVGGRQATLEEAWGLPAAAGQPAPQPLRTPVERAAARAAADFWVRVYDLVHVPRQRAGVFAGATAEDALLAAAEGGGVCVNVPGMPAR